MADPLVSLTDPEIEPVVACGEAGGRSRANMGSAKPILRFIGDFLHLNTVPRLYQR
jgi:hypothetical protein